MRTRSLAMCLGIAGLFLLPPPFAAPSAAAQDGKPLVLQEMTWFDIAEYVKTNDMVIIPLGSTEQHGPHLPLGTDYYEALGTCKLISARTGVVVAPVVMAGYSIYHSGFPGTLSLKPETLEQVLFETAEVLMLYGFRRFMFFNYHGGNSSAQTAVIHRINQATEAVAVPIGIGAGFPRETVRFPGDETDMHGGIAETSMMLFLHPDLVKMERAQKPRMTWPPKLREIMALAKEHPELEALFGLYQGVPEETGKGGSSREISSNGVWSESDPGDGNAELGEKLIMAWIDAAVKFIDAWKRVKR